MIILMQLIYNGNCCGRSDCINAELIVSGDIVKEIVSANDVGGKITIVIAGVIVYLW